MKKILIISVISAFFTTNVFAFGHADFIELDEEQAPLVTARHYSTSSQKLVNQHLSVDVFLRDFNESDKEKVDNAAIILEKVMNSQEFKNAVLNFTYKGKNEFIDNNGMTNLEIYNHLMTGAENLMPESVGVMNFDLSLYKSKNPWSKVKGYTTQDSMKIYINKKYFRLSSWTSVDVAGNMAHEWVHKMGFGHDYRDNAERPSSVPYAIGYIVIDIARQLGY